MGGAPLWPLLTYLSYQEPKSWISGRHRPAAGIQVGEDQGTLTLQLPPQCRQSPGKQVDRGHHVPALPR